MTCIVGLAEGGRVYIGGDSAGVAGLDITTRADAKVFRNGPYVMGFTSSFRMGQLLRYGFKPPQPHADDDLDRFMVTQFIEGTRRCLKDGGYAQVHDNTERGGTFLVGIRGRLFTVFGDYQVAEPDDGYTSVGCGEDYALGALYTAKRSLSPTARIRAALRAAAYFSGGVQEPFQIVSTRRMR